MTEALQFWSTLPLGPTTLLALLLGGIVLAFAWHFVRPARALGREFDTALRALEALQAPAGQPPPADAEALLHAIRTQAMQPAALAHVWNEYAQTLHAAPPPDDPRGAPRHYATAAAEAFFTEAVLVDTPLRSEFYKHLPGILTGIGILGTFAGLIGGLGHFAVSSDAEAVRSSLALLVHSVGEAFQVSALAIALAMLVTWIEKTLITARYRQVTRLAQQIDQLFPAAPGLAHLSRLAQSSAVTAVAMQRLGPTLQQALTQSMERLLVRQQETWQQQQTQLAETLRHALVDGLRQPLAEVAEALRHSARSEQAAMSDALQQALGQLASHSAAARDDERAALHASYASAAAPLQATLAALQQTTAQLQASAEGAAALQEASRIEDVRQQKSLQDELSQALRQLAEAVRQAGLATRQGVSDIAEQGRAGLAAIAPSSEALQQVGHSLRSASHDLERSGQQVLAGGERVEQASLRLSAATVQLNQTLSQQQAGQASVTALLSELRETVQQARSEARLSQELTGQLQAAATQLAAAEGRAHNYLLEVNGVLEAAHAAFARQIQNTLHLSNQQFQQELAEAVGHLKTVIDDLGLALEAVLPPASAAPTPMPMSGSPGMRR